MQPIHARRQKNTFLENFIKEAKSPKEIKLVNANPRILNCWFGESEIDVEPESCDKFSRIMSSEGMAIGIDSKEALDLQSMEEKESFSMVLQESDMDPIFDKIPQELKLSLRDGFKGFKMALQNPNALPDLTTNAIKLELGYHYTITVS